MARVWAARQHGQRGFQKLVAIKTLLPHLADEAEFERMFLDEARIASGVHHPNVCEIYELGEEERTLYLAMEWVSGDSMSRLLRVAGNVEALDSRIVARIVADACAGVHAAHELADEGGRLLDVVHRDMTPQNILLTTDGVAKVCDFGVAKALGQLHEQTSAGQLKGKLSYMSPEQVTGAPIDRRSDVFALGCVLYEATTGVRPFKGERDHMVLEAILNGEVPPPTSFIRNFPVELERIILRALAHQPILRYPTAERMRFALEEFLTKGQLVTQSNVAQVVRTRLGEQIERRRERIRHASTLAEQVGWDPAGGALGREADHRSGVQPSRAAQLPGPSASPIIAMGPRSGIEVADNDATLAGHGVPPSTPTIPQAPAAGLAPEGVANPAGDPVITLPIGPGAMMSPFAGGANQQVPQGYGPASGSAPPSESWDAPASNPYGDTLIYDVTRARPLSMRTPQSAEPKEAGAGQYFLAALVGILFAVLIGGGVFFVWQRTGARAAHPLRVLPASASASAMTAAPSSSAAAPAIAPAPEISFNVTPAEALIVVDGKELEGGRRSIPRPAAGKSVTVVLRARDHEDASLQVDYFTTAPVEISLRRTVAAEIDSAPSVHTAHAAEPMPPASPGATAAPAVTARPAPRQAASKEPSGLPGNPD
jgi:serine/threonine-protein kinase